MGQKLFSESLQPFIGEILNPRLIDSIAALTSVSRLKKIKIFNWNDYYIAVSITIPVELPPLGTFENIDIRDREPILVVLSKDDYPTIGPIVYPDRLDFPKNKLAHLYVAQKGKPPAFCLVREGITEWYANKRLADLYIRVSNWLRDAASGMLSEDGEQFDPIRLEGYSGSMIYDYDQIVDIVNKKNGFTSDVNFAIAFFERSIPGNCNAFKLIKLLTANTIASSVEDLKKEQEKTDVSPSKKSFYFGYILWADTSECYKDYTVDFPENWGELKAFCNKFGITTGCLEKQIAHNDNNAFVHIPVIAAVRRPKQLIGFSGDIEFINFTVRVDGADVNGGLIVNTAPVSFYKHAQPLSREKAKQISGAQVNLGHFALIAGCGALGSKVVMHFARSGATNYYLTDPDDISPHNLVRHALFGNAEGLNKAEALAKEISGIFPHQKIPLLLSSKFSGSLLIGPNLNEFYSWILDFTASNAFAQSLIMADLQKDTRVVKAFITDFGKMGIVFLEGNQRNPRMDDLQILLYARHNEHPFISNWLKREAENSAETNNLSITVGVGCNSETTVLADDLVSLHAAVTSAIIKTESQENQAEEGRIYVNVIQEKPFFASIPYVFKIPPLEVLSAVNDPSWQIRMRSGIIAELKKEMGLSMPSETGGVFCGRSDYKTKVIHVTQFIKAPKDSIANEVCFFRGIQGLPAAIKELNEATGNQLGYIGEWHTHPFGPDEMSTTDARALKKFKKEFSELPSPLPVFMMIITPTHILPYVY